VADIRAFSNPIQGKLTDIDGLEKGIDRDRCDAFYISTARLLEDIEGKDYPEACALTAD